MGSRSKVKAPDSPLSSVGLTKIQTLLARLDVSKIDTSRRRPTRAKPPIPTSWRFYPIGTRPDTDEAARRFPGHEAISDRLAHALAVRVLRRGDSHGTPIDISRAA